MANDKPNCDGKSAEPAGEASDARVFPSDWAIPSFTKRVLSPRSTKYCIVIPVINEGERIAAQLRHMAVLGLMQQADTIVADGGSTDGSLDGDMLAATGVRTLLVKTGPGRLSAQLRMAYAWALAEGYDGIVTIDGNGKDSVEDIPKFLNALGQGYDYAQASRFIRGGRGVNTPLSRTLAIRLLHAPIISLAARRRLTDTTQGFRAYSRRYLSDPHVQPFREIFDRYELLAYLSVRAGRLGYRVVEIPTTRIYPQTGAIPTKINGIGGNLDLIRVLVGVLTGAYDP